MEFGRFEIFQLSDGLFQLTDAMMEELSPDSEQAGAGPSGRILISINVVLVRSGDQIILGDTGIGTKHRNQACNFPAPKGKFRSVKEQLSDLGLQPESISHILLTHLHYDHAGGLTCLDGRGDLIPSYPNAQLFIQEEEWEAAQQAVYKGSRGYRSENWGVYQNSLRITFVDGEEEILPGIRLIRTNGHTRGHQIIRIDSGDGRIAMVLGDLIPTPSHFNKNLRMKVDYNGEVSRQARAELVDRAIAENWLLFFYHAPHLKAGTGYRKNNGSVKVKKFSDATLWPVVADRE